MVRKVKYCPMSTEPLGFVSQACKERKVACAQSTNHSLVLEVQSVQEGCSHQRHGAQDVQWVGDEFESSHGLSESMVAEQGCRGAEVTSISLIGMDLARCHDCK